MLSQGQNLKIFEIKRGGSTAPVKCTNGDMYDSSGRLLSGRDVIYTTNVINTDPSIKFKDKSGILSKGIYYGIVGTRYNPDKNDWSGKKVIKLFRFDTDLDKIKDHTQLSDYDMTLPSDMPNPTQGGKAIVQYVQIHAGGVEWDYSQGCITLLNEGDYAAYDILMGHLTMNEKIIVNLI